MITCVSKIALASLIMILGSIMVTMGAIPTVDTSYSTVTSLETTDGMIYGLSGIHTTQSDGSINVPAKKGKTIGSAMYSESMISGKGNHVYSGVSVLSSSNASKYNIEGERFVSTNGPGTLVHDEQYAVDGSTDAENDPALCPGVGAVTKGTAKTISSSFASMGSSAVLSNGSKTSSGRISAFPATGGLSGVEYGVDADGTGTIDVIAEGFTLSGDKSTLSGETRISERVGAKGKFNLSKSMSYTHRL